MMTDDLTFRELEFTRVFEAPRQLVWDAWTDPDQLASWWGPEGMHVPRDSVELDVRPGGVLRLTMVQTATGTEFPSDMRFTRVEPPEVLGYAWDAAHGRGGGSVVVTFRDLGDGRTELVNHYAGYINDVIQGFMLRGYRQQEDKLALYLS